MDLKLSDKKGITIPSNNDDLISVIVRIKIQKIKKSSTRLVNNQLVLLQLIRNLNLATIIWFTCICHLLILL